MSTRRDLDQEREQREWDAQESALGAECGRSAPEGDALVAQYRLVARALRNPQLDPLPSDFAALTVARVELQSRIASERVEVWLERALVALLVLAGAVAVVVYNGESLREWSFTLPTPAAFGMPTIASWGIAIAGCVGISWAFDLASKR